jgi:hypothetical protein
MHKKRAMKNKQPGKQRGIKLPGPLSLRRSFPPWDMLSPHLRERFMIKYGFSAYPACATSYENNSTHKFGWVLAAHPSIQKIICPMRSNTRNTMKKERQLHAFHPYR